MGRGGPGSRPQIDPGAAAHDWSGLPLNSSAEELADLEDDAFRAVERGQTEAEAALAELGATVRIARELRRWRREVAAARDEGPRASLADILSGEVALPATLLLEHIALRTRTGRVARLDGAAVAEIKASTPTTWDPLGGWWAVPFPLARRTVEELLHEWRRGHGFITHEYSLIVAKRDEIRLPTFDAKQREPLFPIRQLHPVGSLTFSLAQVARAAALEARQPAPRDGGGVT